MRGTLLVVAGFLAVCIFHRHQTDGRIDERTNSSYARKKARKTTMESTPESEDRLKQEFLQDSAENLTDIKDLREEKHPRKQTFSANVMNLWATKRETPSKSEPNIFEDLEDYRKTNDDGGQLISNIKRKHQQQSDSTKVRSSRQRRTVQTPETTLICQDELSCRNRCQNPRTVSYQTQLSCFCDEDCEFFRDCCADYNEFCGTNGQNVTNSTTQNTSTAENLVNQQNRDLWSCYEGEKVKGTKGVWMIGSCPSSWPEDDVLYRCRNLSIANKITIDNYRYLPVYTGNGRVYHNRFCAQCNGVSPKNLTGFSLSIECDFTPPRHLTFESTMSYLFLYCKKISTTKIASWSPRKGDSRRYCLLLKEVTTCLSTLNINKNITKCLTGKPRIVNREFFYRNIDCAKCDDQMNQISCGPNITATGHDKVPPWELKAPPKPFSAIFDFNNEESKGLKSMQIKTRCPDETVYDHYLDICTDAMPPALPNLKDFYKYQVVLWLQPQVSQYKGVGAYHQGIAQELAVPIEQVRNIELERNNISFSLQIRTYERLHRNVRNILDFTSAFNITINRVLYTVFIVTKRILSCANRQKYDRSEYTVLQDGSSAVSIKKTGEVFQYTDYYINTTETSTSANDSQAIFVCRQPQISNCSGVYILINEGDFRVLMNKSIFVNASQQVYDRSEYTWINKSVLVCENFSKTYYESKVVSNDDPLLTTITLVCMSLSIIGLVFVLVTYSLFSELRTPPGINLMNLSVSILLAQLLWILGSGQTDTPMACTVIAVILHYLFLVSFMWTSIIAFDTWRAFSAENRAFSASNHEKYLQVLRHMAVGWLPALVYVGICVVLDITDTVNIGYKSRIACWMADKWAILYFFAVPVFMFLVFNMVFCVMTFRAIKVTTAQARAATDHDTKENFGIYVRIASLMGFTWIFGFAAPFGWQFLWYPFVILNGLQGVYIALAFAFNKRARGLYNWLLRRKVPPQKATSLSTFSRTNTNESSYNNESFDIRQ